MLTKDAPKKREQIQFASTEDLVPENHLLRQIERAVDFSFIYKLVEDKYSPDKGRPSIDPVVLIKIVLLQYLYGIRSMRQTIEDIRYHTAYRWFLGLDLYEEPPHFSTFGKNYKRRFEGTDLFDQIFSHVLMQCMSYNLVDINTLFVDSTHVKASANKNKRLRKEVVKQAKSYHKELMNEINRDREEHGKKPFDEGPPESTTVTESKTDPDSGMFAKGEHDRVFAFSVQTACDRHGWIICYDIAAGNVHDSISFEGIFAKLKPYDPWYVVMDAGYKTPAIVRRLLLDGIIPVVPYTRPRTGKGYFKKHEYVYDEHHDCYLCPQNQILSYSTTNRDGYKEYKSKCNTCKNCPVLKQCTGSKNHVKVVTRHVWEGFMEMAHQIRYVSGMKQLYEERKETIERDFGDAKEKHGMRYTQYRGKPKVAMQVALTYTVMNLKKLARWLARSEVRPLLLFFRHINTNIKKDLGTACAA